MHLSCFNPFDNSKFLVIVPSKYMCFSVLIWSFSIVIHFFCILIIYKAWPLLALDLTVESFIPIFIYYHIFCFTFSVSCFSPQRSKPNLFFPKVFHIIFHFIFYCFSKYFFQEYAKVILAKSFIHDKKNVMNSFQTNNF